MRNDASLFTINALRNALYHTAQRRLFENRARWLNFLVVALGAAAVSDALKPIGITPLHLGGFTALIGALQLTFDFSGRARTHELLQRDYYEALAKFQAILEPDPVQIAAANAGLTVIMADEPPTMKAKDARAYNDAIDATGLFPKGERLHVPLWHRIFKNIFAFEGSDYQSINQIKERKEKDA